MKKVIFTLFLTLMLSVAFSQTTYYWVGGAAGSWSDPLSWSTTVGGAGGARTTPAANDILTFDGSNIGGGATGTVTVQPTIETIGRLMLVNAANVALQRSSSGTTTLTIAGLGTPADLSVDATSTLHVTGNDGVMLLVLPAAAKGEIRGVLNITGTASNRVSVQGAGNLKVLSGGTVNAGSGTNPFSTTTSSNASADRAVIFENGSSFVFKGGTSNPFGTSSTNIIVFNTGSTLVFEAANPANMFNSRLLSNVTVRNGATVTADANWFNVDNILVEATSTFNLRVSGTHPVAGNITNNGTFGAASGFTTTNLVMIGTAPQTIGGTGVFNPFGALTIGADADVTLNRSIVVSGTPTTSILGKLNIGSNTITGGGNFQSRQSQTVAPTATYTAGNHTITVNDFTGITVGLKVTGANFPANTYVIATSSGNLQFTASKAPLASGTSQAITLSAGDPTLQIANAGGVDAAFATTGTTRSFGTGTNFIFNTATTTPFSTTASVGNAIGDLVLNAPITTNRNVTLDGTLTLNTGILTLRSTDTLRIISGNAIAGAPFSTSKYIVASLNAGTGEQGVLRMDNFAAARLFPVGTATAYLPATITPATPSDFAVSAFTGITQSGTPNGTPLSAAQKQKVVDAVWTINRPNGAGTAMVMVSWPASLEGSTFSTYSNSEIGIARNDGGNWQVIGGSGDNTTNTATNSFDQFSPFAVGGRVGEVLPVTLKQFSATTANNAVDVKWTTVNEINMSGYQLQRSADGRNFSTIYTVAANNISVGDNNYSYKDQSATGVVYYRVLAVSKDGANKYTNIIKVSLGKAISLQVYPNPAVDVISITGLQANDQVRIIDLKGNSVIRQQNNRSSATTINVAALPAGTYMVEVTGEGRHETRSIIKK